MLSVFNFYKHFMFIFMLYFCKTQLVSNRYLHQSIKETEIASCIQAVAFHVCMCVCVCVCVCVLFLEREYCLFPIPVLHTTDC